jgi:hypothetical protein
MAQTGHTCTCRTFGCKQPRSARAAMGPAGHKKPSPPAQKGREGWGHGSQWGGVAWDRPVRTLVYPPSPRRSGYATPFALNQASMRFQPSLAGPSR